MAGATTAETIRLRIGDAQDPTSIVTSPIVTNPNGGGDLGNLSARRAFRVSGQSIDGVSRAVDYPGATNGPGHRVIDLENHGSRRRHDCRYFTILQQLFKGNEIWRLIWKPMYPT